MAALLAPYGQRGTNKNGTNYGPTRPWYLLIILALGSQSGWLFWPEDTQPE